MKKIIQKIASFLFILLGFTPLLFVLVFTIKKQEIRHRMKENLEEKQLQTLILPENQVVWMDEHEIWANNSMFDIHTKKLEHGIYTFTGLYDEEETMLVEREKNAAGKNNEQNQLLTDLFKCLPEFCDQSGDAAYSAPQYICYNSFIPRSPVHPFREILTPPPQA